MYEGHFKSAKRHGQGEYRWSNGNKYSGNWVNDVIDGKGTFMNLSNGQT